VGSLQLVATLSGSAHPPSQRHVPLNTAHIHVPPTAASHKVYETVMHPRMSARTNMCWVWEQWLEIRLRCLTDVPSPF
jgi:hypothetical protein